MTNNAARGGLLLGLGAYAMWGVLPLYFRWLGGVPALEVLAHRVVWSLALLVIVVTAMRRWTTIRAAVTARTLAMLAASALLIGTNWLIYIWAVNNHQTLAASLGYFINPLVNVALGVAVLGERLRRWQGVAIGIASVGVLAMALGAADTLWISLMLALSFGLYGLVRKTVAIDSLGGLMIETLLLAPPSLIYLMLVAQDGGGAFGGDLMLNAKLVMLGGITAAPLLMFAAAARRLPYSSLALLQYLAPTLQFIVAVAVFGEALRSLHFLVFGLIWAGCALFAWDSVRAARARR
ncbi:EamA family transporter RarD [Sphingomonas jeddahensis]|uniref:EamA-like transporter family protein n=1 Tax=Sphingomonas jeddahensis TaxID=1915074 RepID=A0A1V2ET22_9SPHN|nr:EamA family transporter RarD [Sphingomonas jeddahensis]ONF95647.1 EamA-like transporter family protein [Sphingomonas jeddahensis]